MTSRQPSYADHSAVPPLWLPYYGAPPVEAVKRVFRKYAVFTGRASRSEYWWWFLASTLASAVLNAINPTLINGQTTGSSTLGGLWFLATVVPSLAVAARRLHDVNLNAWWLLLAIIPVLGWIALIVMLAQRQNPLGQRFDRHPGARYGQTPTAPPHTPQQPPYPPAPGGPAPT